MLSPILFTAREKRTPYQPDPSTLVTIYPEWTISRLYSGQDSVHIRKPAKTAPDSVEQIVEQAKDELSTPQERKVWNALNELVLKQNKDHLRQLDIHKLLREKYGSSVDSNIILPLMDKFAKLTNRQVSASSRKP